MDIRQMTQEYLQGNSRAKRPWIRIPPEVRKCFERDRYQLKAAVKLTQETNLNIDHIIALCSWRSKRH